MSGRQLSDGLFLAVAHPVRRRILELAVERGEVEVAELRRELPLTPSALSQHLRVLREAELVAPRREGRRLTYQLTPEPLLEVVGWMRAFEAAWARHLDALGLYLEVESARAPDQDGAR